MEKRWKLSVEVSPNCPRCGSSNTKFCYYNIYSLTQPRYFCKGCRRYWTKGGSLRNVPVGGGCRKNRRVKYLRLPIGCVPSKNLSCGVVPTEPTRHGSNGCNTSDGSHIDLTLVYANYLNQPPGNKPGFEYDPPSHDHFSSLSNTNFDSRILQPEENGLIGCLNHSTENHICYSGLLESVHKHQDGVQDLQTSHETTSNYELSQFPGDVLSSQDFLWSNSDSPTSHALETSPETVLGEAVEDSNPWFGNWSPFDFVL